ncbi:MAG TPA: MEDS domain-containing protein [Burkholderiales bacterium]|nr:MEDS domain-containing protein [Burkholderiales bacterium]
MNPLASALQRVGSHDHLCSIHGTDAERIALAVHFLRIGLARGEKCVYVDDDGGGKAIASALAADGANVERFLARGALAFTTRDGAQLGSSRFAPEQTLAFWQREAAAAKRHGYCGVRCATDVACDAEELRGLGRWLEYEARLTDLLGQSDCMLLCQYDGARCPSSLLMEMLQGHPLVFHEGTVCRNPYFAPLGELGMPAGDDLAVQRWLRNIGQSEGLELRNRQGQDALTRKQHDLEVAHQRLAAEHETMARFHQLSVRLISQSDVQKTLGDVLDAVMRLQRADLGTIELQDPESGTLQLVAQRGFTRPLLERLRALDLFAMGGNRTRATQGVMVEDVDADGTSAALRELGARAGFRALCATPLLGRRGRRLGAITTYFRAARRPGERELRLLELYAGQAAQIIERRRKEDALRRSEAYLEAGQRISHTGSWAWNACNGELFWSAEHYRIMGLERRNVKASVELFLARVHPDDRARVREAFEAAVRERRDFASDCRIVRADGSVRHIRSQAQATLDDAGVLHEYIGAVIDVTERKESEDAIRKARAELAHVNRALTVAELTASIAHELNQPLAAVVANANACERWLAVRPPNEPEAHAALRRITRDANRAADVIARIRTLLLGREVVKSELRPGEPIAEVIALVELEARHKEIVVSAAIEDELPAIHADRVRIQQVLLNLLVNAMDALASASPPRTIEVAARREGGEVTVRVKDSGSGIEPRNLEHLFEPFFTTRADGMGMGLAISRSIIEEHDGRIRAFNNGDSPGATVQFWLPAHLYT